MGRDGSLRFISAGSEPNPALVRLSEHNSKALQTTRLPDKAFVGFRKGDHL